MIYSVLADFTLMRAVDYILYAYIRAVVIIAGPAAYAVLLSTVFAFTLLSVMMTYTLARHLFFNWVWRREHRKALIQ